MKKGYLVVELVINDAEKYEGYRQQVLPLLEEGGGRFIVRGGARLQLEGSDDSHHDQIRTVVVEFASMDAALAWYRSPAYQRLKAIRESATVSRAFAVEGL